MKRKFYKITLSGESLESCIRELSNKEYNLLWDIFHEIRTPYESIDIDEVVKMYSVVGSFNNKGNFKPLHNGYGCGFYDPNLICNGYYPDLYNPKNKIKLFNTENEANEFLNKFYN